MTRFLVVLLLASAALLSACSSSDPAAPSAPMVVGSGLPVSYKNTTVCAATATGQWVDCFGHVIP